MEVQLWRSDRVAAGPVCKGSVAHFLAQHVQSSVVSSTTDYYEKLLTQSLTLRSPASTISLSQSLEIVGLMKLLPSNQVDHFLL